MLKLLGASIGAIAWSIGCAPSATVSAQLQHALEHASRGDVVRLRDLTDFEWDYFIALGPYTTRDEADAALGFAWPDFDRFDLTSSDAFSLLVFTRNGSVIRVEKHPRCRPDFAPGTLNRPLSPAAAAFTIDFHQDCPAARAAA